MTHYEKLATMIFRSLGLLFTLVGIAYLAVAIYALILAYAFSFIVWLNYVNAVWLPIMILGFVFYSFSKKLAKRTCRDLY